MSFKPPHPRLKSVLTVALTPAKEGDYTCGVDYNPHPHQDTLSLTVLSKFDLYKSDFIDYSIQNAHKSGPGGPLNIVRIRLVIHGRWL